MIDLIHCCFSCVKIFIYKSDSYSNNDQIELIKNNNICTDNIQIKPCINHDINNINNINDIREKIVKEYVNQIITNVIENSIKEITNNKKNFYIDEDDTDYKLSDDEEIGIFDWVDNDDNVNINIDFIKKNDRARLMRLKYEKYVDIRDKDYLNNLYNNTISDKKKDLL